MMKNLCTDELKLALQSESLIPLEQNVNKIDSLMQSCACCNLKRELFHPTVSQWPQNVGQTLAELLLSEAHRITQVEQHAIKKKRAAAEAMQTAYNLCYWNEQKKKQATERAFEFFHLNDFQMIEIVNPASRNPYVDRYRTHFTSPNRFREQQIKEDVLRWTQYLSPSRPPAAVLHKQQSHSTTSSRKQRVDPLTLGNVVVMSANEFFNLFPMDQSRPSSLRPARCLMPPAYIQGESMTLKNATGTSCNSSSKKNSKLETVGASIRQQLHISYDERAPGRTRYLTAPMPQRVRTSWPARRRAAQLTNVASSETCASALDQPKMDQVSVAETRPGSAVQSSNVILADSSRSLTDLQSAHLATDSSDQEQNEVADSLQKHQFNESDGEAVFSSSSESLRKFRLSVTRRELHQNDISQVPRSPTPVLAQFSSEPTSATTLSKSQPLKSTINTATAKSSRHLTKFTPDSEVEWCREREESRRKINKPKVKLLVSGAKVDTNSVPQERLLSPGVVGRLQMPAQCNSVTLFTRTDVDNLGHFYPILMSGALPFETKKSSKRERKPVYDQPRKTVQYDQNVVDSVNVVGLDKKSSNVAKQNGQ